MLLPPGWCCCSSKPGSAWKPAWFFARHQVPVPIEVLRLPELSNATLPAHRQFRIAFPSLRWCRTLPSVVGSQFQPGSVKRNRNIGTALPDLALWCRRLRPERDKLHRSGCRLRIGTYSRAWHCGLPTGIEVRVTLRMVSITERMRNFSTMSG